MEELVSIVMPTYNCANFIEESIKSVLAQHHINWELLIVDNGSTDNTQAILAPYLAKYPNIHYTCLEKNSGMDVARSTALQQAKGDYVAFLESDDVWTPNKLALQIDFMKQHKAAFSATGYEIANKDNTSQWIAFIPPKKTDYKKMLRLGFPIANSTVMYARQIMGEPSILAAKQHHEYALWLQALHKTDACYGIPDILAICKVPSNQNDMNFIFSLWHLYHDIEKLGVIKSMWYILCYGLVKGSEVGIHKVDLKKPKSDVADSVLYYE